ncbi:MAG: hypothetical protein R3267_01190 [Paenisporosarcina sp.]|nr:hypothetical protein [Paenisporosarcina sp.]
MKVVSEMPTQFKLAKFAGRLCMNSAALGFIPKHHLDLCFSKLMSVRDLLER